MGLVLLTERHVQQIAGVLSRYDRMIVQGTLPVFCYADGMTAYLSKRGIRIFHFIQFAKPLTDALKANAEGLAAECNRNNTATSVPQAWETPDRFIPDPIHKKPLPSPRAWERFET
jgi:hypothetical protein